MRTVALGEIVDFYSGGTPSKSVPEFWKGNVPWFSAKDMKHPYLTDSSDHLSEEVFTRTSLRRVPAETVAMVVRGMILAHTVPIAVLGVDSAINQDLKALLPRCDINVQFLAAMLRAQHEVILSRVSTAAHGTKKLDTRVLKSIRIPFPPLVEQRRIATILERASGLRTRHREILLRFDQFESAAFHQLISGATKLTSLGDLIIDGPTNGLYMPASSYGTGTQIIRIDSFDKGRLNGRPLKRLEVTVSDSKRFAVQTGDILINRVNSLTHLGKSLLVPKLTETTVFESNMMRMRVDSGQVLPVFVNTWLRSDACKSQIQGRAKKAINQASINQKDVRSLHIPKPSLKDQREFARLVQQIDTQRLVTLRALAAHDDLFASLQSRAFRGEL